MGRIKLKVVSHPMLSGLEETVNIFVKDKNIADISFQNDGSRFYAFIVYKE